MENSKCPNCGANVPKDASTCPNCGATKYPRPQRKDRRDAMRDWAFGKPLARATGTTVLIACGLFFGFMGGCGVYVAITGEDVVKAFGVFFALLGFLLVLYAVWEFRRSLRSGR